MNRTSPQRSPALPDQVRDKLVLSGLYLSKFDRDGLRALGFSGFVEAFNAIASSVDASPASVKNYRDEFDPCFPNKRSGWRNRPMRGYCKKILERYGHLDLGEFSDLIRSEISVMGELAVVAEQVDGEGGNSFANRLITGQAAERYFERVYKTVSAFQSCSLTNTTLCGCGFDYKMTMDDRPYLAVEVKGMAAARGAIQMTGKEYKVAQLFSDRYFLFVVLNFSESPFHRIYQNPLGTDLVFERREVISVQETWRTSVG